MSTSNELISEPEKPYKGAQDEARAQVLAELAELFLSKPSVDVDEFTKDELAKATGRKASGIYDQLHDWVLAGEITQRRVGPQTYYKLPPAKVRELLAK